MGVDDDEGAPQSVVKCEQRVEAKAEAIGSHALLHLYHNLEIFCSK